MAEDAAYLNVATSQTSRPTIFELVSQEGMQQCLKPAIQLLCQHLTEYRPDLFAKYYAYFNELYLVFDLFLEGHYIWTRSASFGEHFYGLKRVPCMNIFYTFFKYNKETFETEKLNLRSKLLSLIGLCVLPYIFSKIQQKFKNLQEKDWDYEPFTPKEEKFFRIFPYLDAMMQIVDLVFKFLYLTRKSEFYSLLYCLQSLKIGRETNMSENRSNFPYFTQLSRRSLFLNLVLSPLGVANLIGYGFTHLLPFAIFLIKFLQHWYSQHDQSVFHMYNTLPIPPPPPKSEVTDSNKCPLCQKEFRKPSAVAVSGWVYCYTCITTQIRAQGKCPVSGLSADMDDIIILYT